MTPIVHIGFHKTATTWFQQSFYPAVTSHRLVDRATTYGALIAPDPFAFDAVAARTALGADTAKILCEENLSGYIHNGGLSGYGAHAVAGRIRTVLPDARIVIFVRAQPAMAAAAYLQYVRTGGTHGPARYLLPRAHLRGAAGDPWKAARFSLDHLGYDRLVERYRALFGGGAVHVFAVEEMRADPAGFARRYAERLGLRVDWERVTMAPRNVGYGRVALTLSRYANLFTHRAVIDKTCLLHIPGLYSARRWAVERLNAVLPGKPLSPHAVLGGALQAEIEDRFRVSNARLAWMTALDLDAFGYPLPHALPWPEVDPLPALRQAA